MQGDRNNALIEYDDTGRCIGTEIIVVICSMTNGAVDPTSCREYKLYCPICKSKIFFEGESLEVLVCRGCAEFLGVKDMGNELC